MDNEMLLAHKEWKAKGEPTASAVVILSRGLVLVERGPNGDRLPGLPGGKREPGETPVQCAVRETFEETGVMLDPDPDFLIQVHAGNHLTNIYWTRKRLSFDKLLLPSDLLSNSRFPEIYAKVFACLVCELDQ